VNQLPANPQAGKTPDRSSTDQSSGNKAKVNNAFYETLGERWYTATDDPVALLRAESKMRIPWVLERIGTPNKNSNEAKKKVLDIGCGAGFLSNPLGAAGHDVTAIDLSTDSLRVAKLYDKSNSVRYVAMDASKLEFEDARFDVVCAMDFLEHVENPEKIFQEASRVLKPGGIFLFHTFNRNWLSYLVIIKGVEWFVKNTPKQMHVLHLFVKPSEAREYCACAGLTVERIRGVTPVFLCWAFWKMIFTRRVPPDFRFRFTSLPLTGFSGVAVKK
jgi:2-polyprenyl-6-hydroxyphenyl methylase/3-demethylubiquinone-9 3-methyltransferase